MPLDPEKIGVWVPAYMVALAPNSSAALLLAQVTWLIQPDRTGMRRTDIIEREGHEWIARTDEDWWWIGLDRLAARRARLALVKESLLYVRPGSANGRKVTLLRPDLGALTKVRIRAIEELQTRGYARSKVRIGTIESSDPRDCAIYLENTPQREEQTQQAPLVMQTPAVIAPDRFDEFWGVYPRKDSRAAAQRAWVRAIKRYPAEAIIEAARSFAADPNLPAMTYRPHASTWLNNDRWADPPLPRRVVTDRGGTDAGTARVLERLNGRRG